MAKQSLNELITKYQDQERLYHFEGDSGVRNFEKLVGKLGYNDRWSASTLHAFLADNSGAVEALLNWINDQNSEEWAENLSQHIYSEEDEDDDQPQAD